MEPICFSGAFLKLCRHLVILFKCFIFIFPRGEILLGGVVANLIITPLTTTPHFCVSQIKSVQSSSLGFQIWVPGSAILDYGQWATGVLLTNPVCCPEASIRGCTITASQSSHCPLPVSVSSFHSPSLCGCVCGWGTVFTFSRGSHPWSPSVVGSKKYFTTILE